MSLLTLRWIGAFAAVVALSAAEAGAQDQAGGPRSLVPSPATAGVGTARSPVRLHDQTRAGELRVPMNKSQVIEVDRSFAEVSVGNPAIADVTPLTQRALYVFGKQLGTTSLTITDSGGDIIAIVDLVVSYDIEGLRANLFELLPGQPVEVRPAADG
jgi:pilus assembly protein CpaC